jgi:hypothetical protein
MYGGAVGVPEGWALGLDIGCFDGRHSGCRLGPTYIHTYTNIYIYSERSAALSHSMLRCGREPLIPSLIWSTIGNNAYVCMYVCIHALTLLRLGGGLGRWKTARLGRRLAQGRGAGFDAGLRRRPHDRPPRRLWRFQSSNNFRDKNHTHCTILYACSET